MVDINYSFTDIAGLLPKLPKPYFWQKTPSGVTLFDDRRKFGGGRQSLGHFMVEAVLIHFGGRRIDDFCLSIKKRERVEQSVDRLRDQMAKILPPPPTAEAAEQASQ